MGAVTTHGRAGLGLRVSFPGDTIHAPSPSVAIGFSPDPTTPDPHTQLQPAPFLQGPHPGKSAAMGRVTMACGTLPSLSPPGSFELQLLRPPHLRTARARPSTASARVRLAHSLPCLPCLCMMSNSSPQSKGGLPGGDLPYETREATAGFVTREWRHQGGALKRECRGAATWCSGERVRA